MYHVLAVTKALKIRKVGQIQAHGFQELYSSECETNSEQAFFATI